MHGRIRGRPAVAMGHKVGRISCRWQGCLRATQAWMGLLSFKPVIHQIRIVRQMVPCLLALQPPAISLVISCIFLILCLELRFLCCWQPAALRSAAPPLFQANSSQPVWRTRLSQRTKTREHACCNAAIRSTFWLPQQLAYLPTSNGKQQQTPTLPTANCPPSTAAQDYPQQRLCIPRGQQKPLH